MATLTNRDKRLLEYIVKHGSISSLEAFRLGETRLAAWVCKMQQHGTEFERQRVQTKNRYGEPTSYMRYRLKEGWK